MAKKEKAEKSSKEKAAARKEKNNQPQNSYQRINDFDGIITDAMYIRNHGVLVRESGKAGTSSTFIPDTKIKKKGVNFVLVKETDEMREAKAEKRKASKEKKAKEGKKSKKDKS